MRIESVLPYDTAYTVTNISISRKELISTSFWSLKTNLKMASDTTTRKSPVHNTNHVNSLDQVLMRDATKGRVVQLPDQYDLMSAVSGVSSSDGASTFIENLLHSNESKKLNVPNRDTFKITKDHHAKENWNNAEKKKSRYPGRVDQSKEESLVKNKLDSKQKMPDKRGELLTPRGKTKSGRRRMTIKSQSPLFERPRVNETFPISIESRSPRRRSSYQASSDSKAANLGASISSLRSSLSSSKAQMEKESRPRLRRRHSAEDRLNRRKLVSKSNSELFQSMRLIVEKEESSSQRKHASYSPATSPRRRSLGDSVLSRRRRSFNQGHFITSSETTPSNRRASTSSHRKQYKEKYETSPTKSLLWDVPKSPSSLQKEGKSRTSIAGRSKSPSASFRRRKAHLLNSNQLQSPSSSSLRRSSMKEGKIIQ